MTLAKEIARIMCCPGGTCAWPERCFAERRGEQTLVDIRSAAEHVARAVPGLVADLWRKQAGPYSRNTPLESAQRPSRAVLPCMGHRKAGEN